MTMLWNKDQERDFFTKSLESAQPETLFYQTERENKRFLAYWPKNYGAKGATLQSRNAWIGRYTEKWCADLFGDIARTVGGYAVQGVVSKELGLPKESKADVAICRTKEVVQSPENIMMIIEVKMSVVWNWECIQNDGGDFELVCIGDYSTHQGTPGLLRSDTMLKAIGKSINVRVSSSKASKIPIVIVGNTPIAESYYEKVDHLRRNGIIQGFWSVNPKPLDGDIENIKNTPYRGFYRMDSYEELKQNALSLIGEEREFFSSMQTKQRLGKIIEIAGEEPTYEAKAQRFLDLMRESNG